MKARYIMVLIDKYDDQHELKKVLKDDETTKYEFVCRNQMICGLRWGGIRPNELINLIGEPKTNKERQWWNYCIVPSFDPKFTPENVKKYELEGEAPKNEQIEKAFNRYYPSEAKTIKSMNIREKAKELAYLIDEKCPNSREKSLAMTKLEEFVMWAIASIERN